MRDIRTLFETEEEKKERKKIELKEINDRLNKDIMTLFEQEEVKDYYKPKIVSNFWNNNYIE